mgnify:CR=1 FL=1
MFIKFLVLFFLSCVLNIEKEPDKVLIEVQDIEKIKSKGLNTSIKSSVKISVYSEDTEVGSGSGNYFFYKRKKFIITAAHVVDQSLSDENVFYARERFGSDMILCEVVFIDTANDVAIIMPKRELITVTPVKYRPSFHVDIGDDIYHAGYPAGLDLYTTKGRIASIHANAYILQSLAWMGASGSVVFDKKGKVVGVLSALKVGATPLGGKILENIVFVSPVKFLDNYIKKSLLKK